MLFKRALSATLLTAACLALFATSCVGPSASKAGGGRQVVMTINDRPVYADDLVKSFILRQALQQYVVIEAFRAEAKRRNVRIDPTELKKKVDDQVKQLTANGTEDLSKYLKERGMTEKEIADSIEFNMLMDKVVETMVTITDQELKDSWSKQQDTYVDEYLKKNKLPDTEKKNVTFDKCRDMIRETLVGSRKMEAQGKLFNEVILKATLKLDGISEPAERKIYEDLILGGPQERVRDSMKKEEAQKGGAPPATSPPPPPGKVQQGVPPAKGQPPVPKENPKGNGGSQGSKGGQGDTGGGSKGGKGAGK